MSDAIICKFDKCNKYLFDPIILPCANNVCKAHLDELTQNEDIGVLNKKFKCLVCDKRHSLPSNGFLMNTAIKEFVDFNLHLNGYQKRVADKIRTNGKAVDFFEKIFKDPKNFISDHISTIRFKINFERGRLINEINELADEMIGKLQAYENECRENLKNSHDLKKEYKNFLANKSLEMMNMKEELRIPNIDTGRLDDLLNQANLFLNEIKAKYLDYKNSLLMNKDFHFNPFNIKFDRTLFGELVLINSSKDRLHYLDMMNRLNSRFSLQSNEELLSSKRTKYEQTDSNTKLNSSILTANESNNLIRLCEFDAQSEFKLLYRAIKDGFSTEDFHSKCDGVANTLTIIKVKGKSNVFGGFTAQTWDKNSRYTKDSKAFIFSLINQDNLPLKINVSVPAKAIYNRSDCGPTFGDDINILNESNLNRKSNSNLGDSYSSDLYTYGTYRAQNFLAGSHNFSTEDIEVFQVLSVV